MDARFLFLRYPAAGSPLPLTHTFTHTNSCHGSVRVLYWPARARVRPSRVLLFFPGNPGIPDYYTHFLTLLHSRLPDTHAVLCTSHVGGDPYVAAPDKPLSLREQVDAKVELVSTLRASLEAWPTPSSSGSSGSEEDGEATPSPPPALAIAGHSVGAWMTCEVAKVLEVSAAYLLFPTLGWIANSYNGWTMWPMFHRPVRPMIPYLSYLIRPILPLVALPPPSRALVTSPTTLRHVLSLASSEMATIRGPEEAWFQAQAKLPAGEGVRGVWSAGNIDGWVGKDGPLVRGWLGEERTVELESVPHAFCLSEDHCSTVADLVAGWIVEDAKLAASQ